MDRRYSLLGTFADGRGPVNCEGAARKKLAVQRANSGLRESFVFEFDKTKATRSAGRAVLNDLNRSRPESL